MNKLKYVLQGNRFGKLVATRYAGRGRWECECDCGKTAVADGNQLRTGRVRSCGCAVSQKQHFSAPEVRGILDDMEAVLVKAKPEVPKMLALEFERMLTRIQEMRNE